MHGSGLWKGGRMLMLAMLLMVACLSMVFVGGCGGDEADEAETATTAATSAEGSEEPAGATGGAGEALAEEILAAFDEVVAEAAGLAKDLPEPAVLKPQLQELYDSYTPRMTELNAEYLALKDADIAEFGACNTYLGSERGKRVTQKDNTLTEAVKHYNLNLGDQEMVELLSKGPVELLEMAVKQN